MYPDRVVPVPLLPDCLVAGVSSVDLSQVVVMVLLEGSFGSKLRERLEKKEKVFGNKKSPVSSYLEFWMHPVEEES